MKPDHTQTLGAIVDRIGIINATIADLKKEAATDWQTIAMRFKPSPQLIRRHTTTAAESIRLTISARKGA